MKRYNICIIGSGNVSYHMSKALFRAGHNIEQIYSRNLINAKLVADRVKAKAISEISEMSRDADLYIIAISDDAISEFVGIIPFKLREGQILVHSAGSVSIDVLKSKAISYGSFYPLQTFSKSRSLSFKKIPMCIYALDGVSMNHLNNISKSISNDVRIVDDVQRKEIHLAAVFACNFVNHLVAEAEQILEKSDIDRSILMPLIDETISKLKQNGASHSQTGPAKRNDKKVIDSHAAMLDDKPDIQKLYIDLSNSIIKKYS